MTNADGYFCGLHYNQKRCDCRYHCTGCTHVYGQRHDDCCSCCKRTDEDR